MPTTAKIFPFSLFSLALSKPTSEKTVPIILIIPMKSKNKDIEEITSPTISIVLYVDYRILRY